MRGRGGTAQTIWRGRTMFPLIRPSATFSPLGRRRKPPHCGVSAKIPQQNQVPPPIFVHPLPTCRRITPFRHRIHRTMRSLARRDRRRGRRLSQVENPGRCNGLPPREAEGETVRTGSPSPPLTRACLRGTQTGARELEKAPRRKDGGVDRAGANAAPPSAGEGQAGRYHPAGSSRATGQASAKVRHRTDARSTPIRAGRCRDVKSRQRRRHARETHAVGKNAERGAARSHLLIL